MSAARKRSTSTSRIGRPLGLRPRTWARKRFARREPGTRSAGPRAARTPTTAPFSVIGAKRGVTLTPPSRARKLAGSAVPSAPVPKRNSTLTKGCAEATVRPAGSTTRRSWFALPRAAETGAGRKTAQQSSRVTARRIRGRSLREEAAPPQRGNLAYSQAAESMATATSFGKELVCSSVRLKGAASTRSEEHTSELQSLAYLVCRLLLEKKK